MRKIIVLILLFAVCMLSGAAWSETSIGKCVRVYEGDTIAVIRDDEEIDVRFDAVDCPEKTQEFFEESTRFTSNLLLGHEVLLDIKNQDRYGRYIARVKIGYRDVSLELVKAGMAWHFKRFSNDEKLAAAEEEARAKKIGIWSLANPIPPWDFRQAFFNRMMPPYNVSEDLPSEKNKNPMVFINKTGECYHRESCPTLKDGKASIMLDEAIQHGYLPCRTCNPPTREDTVSR